MRLLASMIARDERGRYLDRTIPALLGFCDLVVAMDDGSEDATGAYLRSQPRVLVYDPGLPVWGAEGEGVARDRLLRLTLRVAAECGADWVLSVDADELVDDGPGLRRFLEGHDPGELPAAASLTMREVWARRGPRGDRPPGMTWSAAMDGWVPGSQEHRGPGFVAAPWMVRTDGHWAPRECPVLWTPPARELSNRERWEQGWTIPGATMACGREPEVVRPLDAAPSGASLLHLGWSDPGERQARYERYMALDGGRYHDRAHLESILDPAPALEPYPRPASFPA